MVDGSALVVLTALATDRLVKGVKVSVAATANKLGPKLVVSEPVGTVLTNAPEITLGLLVTVTLMTQALSGGIRVPAGMEIKLAPAVAVGNAPMQVLPTAGVAALTKVPLTVVG